jgi:hypothetical protein
MNSPFSRAKREVPGPPTRRAPDARPFPVMGGEWVADPNLPADGVVVREVTPEERDKLNGQPMSEAQKAGYAALAQLAAERAAERGF